MIWNCPISLLCQMMFGTSRLLGYVILPWALSFAGNCPITFVTSHLDRGYPDRIHRWCLVETSSGAWNKRWTERWWWKHVEAVFVMLSCKRCFPSKSIWSKKVVDWFVVWRAPHFLTPDRPGRWPEDGCSWIEWIEKQRSTARMIKLYLMTDDDDANDHGGGDDGWRWIWMRTVQKTSVSVESLVGCSWPIWMILTYQGQKWFQAEGFVVGRTGVCSEKDV